MGETEFLDEFAGDLVEAIYRWFWRNRRDSIVRDRDEKSIDVYQFK